MLRRGLLLSFLGVAACSDGAGPKLRPCTAAGFPVSLAVGEYVAIDPVADSGCTVFPANGDQSAFLALLAPPGEVVATMPRSVNLWTVFSPSETTAVADFSRRVRL